MIDCSTHLDTDLHNVIKKGNILKDVHKRYVMYQVTICVNTILFHFSLELFVTL